MLKRGLTQASRVRNRARGSSARETAVAAGEIPPPPIGLLLDFEIVEVDEGRAVLSVVPHRDTGRVRCEAEQTGKLRAHGTTTCLLREP